MRKWSAWAAGAVLLGNLAVASPVLADSVTRVDVKVSAVVYDPGTQLLYASVPGDVLILGNTVVPINPADGSLGTPIATGSQPGPLARSADGKYLYVGIRGSHSVQRINLKTQAIDFQWDLGFTAVGLNPVPVALAVLPGLPDSVAVALDPGNIGFPSVLAIYDHGVARSRIVTYPAVGNTIQVSASPARLYTTANGGINRIAIGPDGPLLASTDFILLQDEGLVHKGLLYTQGGIVYDPETAIQLGAFAIGDYAGPVCPDSDTGRVFLITSSFPNPAYQLGAYSIRDFGLEGSLSLDPGIGYPTNLIRCGTDGLALTNTDGQLFLIHSSLVPEAGPQTDLQVTSSSPAAAPAGDPVSLTVTVYNNSAHAASGVRLTDTLPAGSHFVSAQASQGAAHGDDTLVTAELGALGPGATATATFTVRPRSAGNLTNTATVTSFEVDAQPADNTASSPVPVTPPTGADLTGKWLSATLHKKRVGRVFQYYLQATLQVRNQGLKPSPRTQLKIYQSDTLPTLIYVLLKTTVPRIPAHGTRKLSLRIPMPVFQPVPDEFAVAVLDAADKISEANEDDNQLIYGPLPVYP